MVEIHCEKGPVPLRQALRQITEQRANDGEYSNQTLLDLRDACMVLLGQVKRVETLCRCELSWADKHKKHDPKHCELWSTAFKMVLGIVGEHNQPLHPTKGHGSLKT